MNFFRSFLSAIVPRFAVWVCLLGLLLQMLSVGWWDVMDDWPEGAHAWRQADALSQTMKFHQHPQAPFWRPSMHFLHGKGGRGAGEFTGSYWLNARLWEWTGAEAPLPATLRWTHVLVWLAGLMALFGWVRHLTESPFLAMLVPWFVQASPVVAFYAPSLLVNPMGLAFVFIAWWAAGRHRWVWAALAMMLAMLFRPTMGLGLVPLVLLAWRDEQWRAAAWASAVAIGGAGAWVVWAKSYNATHESVYFLTSTSPLTEVLKNGQWSTFWTLFQDVMLQEWYPEEVRWLIGAAFVVVLVLAARRRDMRFWAGWAVATLLAVGAYIYMWFGRLNHHDYYLMDVHVLTPVLLVAFHQILPASPARRQLAGFIGLVAIVWSSSSARDRAAMKWGLPAVPEHSKHFSGWEGAMWRNHHMIWRQRLEGMDSLASRWDALGVGEDAVLVCLPDASPNIALSRLGRDGYTGLYENDLKAGQRVAHYASLGATHFVVLDPQILNEGEWNDVSMTPVDTSGAVWLFSLHDE